MPDDQCEEPVNDGFNPALARYVDAMLAQSDGWRLTGAARPHGASGAVGAHAAATQDLLEEVGTELGFVLPRREQARLREAGPWDSEAFTDALFRAEGMSPCVYPHLRQEVRQRAERHLSQSAAASPR